MSKDVDKEILDFVNYLKRIHKDEIENYGEGSIVFKSLCMRELFLVIRNITRASCSAEYAHLIDILSLTLSFSIEDNEKSIDFYKILITLLNGNLEKLIKKQEPNTSADLIWEALKRVVTSKPIEESAKH